MNGTQVFYDSLRALGPIEAETVPNAIANQIMANGMFQGDMSQCKATVALYSMIASTSTVSEFSSVLETGILPSGDQLSVSDKTLAMAGKSCCGHTCEGTCTKSKEDSGSGREERESKR
jgi:hypothetical protein